MNPLFHNMKAILTILITILFASKVSAQRNFTLTKDNYFQSNTGSILVFNDTYSEGHQGGIQIIHHGERIAANGDLWLDPAPGQWDPFSQIRSIVSDSADQIIKVSLCYPNETAASRRFNRIAYPDLNLDYDIEVMAEGRSFRITVVLEKQLPAEWVGKVGFNLELFPGSYFGKKYYMDGQPGIFPAQLNNPIEINDRGQWNMIPIAEGNCLVIAPEDKLGHLKIESLSSSLQLLDGRARHNNGWFIVRSLVPKGIRGKAIEWLITPYPDSSWQYGPVIHCNQVGYLPGQSKTALIECDRRSKELPFIKLVKIDPEGTRHIVVSDSAIYWGRFGRYKYYRFDFSDIHSEGIYFLETGTTQSESFQISSSCYDRGIWQSALEYFLPVQMCHMRVNDRYRVWHGLCHMDDARMAPPDTLHFDGYWQGKESHTPFLPEEHIDGLNKGGWHDAGDYDLRIESQGGTVHMLSLIQDYFRPEYDMTSIDQARYLTEMHRPDGIPDILQQIEHGTLHIVNAYRILGRHYRGIICRDLRQYVLLGDGSTMTDNVVFSDTLQFSAGIKPINDDRWVFTEDNSRRELQLCANLAAASRSLKNYNDSLSQQALEIAADLWEMNRESEHLQEKTIALTELFLSTGETDYLDRLIEMSEYIGRHIRETGWAVARIVHEIDDMRFQRGFNLGVQDYYRQLDAETRENPFGIPYHPRIWGSGWHIQHFGVQQYFLYKHLQVDEASGYLRRSLDFILGVHPGRNTASFVSGVGTRSVMVAYGTNRADWSYIPGGVISGTANIQPDFPELKEWPFLWQQTEYMISGASSGFIFLVLAHLDMSEGQ